jgi:hypothetical protein
MKLEVKDKNRMVNRAIALLVANEPNLNSKTIAAAFHIKPMRVAAIRAHIKMRHCFPVSGNIVMSLDNMVKRNSQ